MKRLLPAIAVGLTLLAQAPAPVSAPAPIVLPEGRGKDIVDVVCTECHTLERVVAHRANEEGWRNILREMTENGAAFDQSELPLLLAYLTKNFGPVKVNINTATAEQIAAALKLTLAEAQVIVKFREANGPFRDIEDFRKLGTIGSKVREAREAVEF